MKKKKIIRKYIKIKTKSKDGTKLTKKQEYQQMLKKIEGKEAILQGQKLKRIQKQQKKREKERKFLLM